MIETLILIQFLESFYDPGILYLQGCVILTKNIDINNVKKVNSADSI